MPPFIRRVLAKNRPGGKQGAPSTSKSTKSILTPLKRSSTKHKNQEVSSSGNVNTVRFEKHGRRRTIGKRLYSSESEYSSSSSSKSSSTSSNSSQELVKAKVRNHFSSNGNRNRTESPSGRCRPNILSKSRVRRLEASQCSDTNSRSQSSNPSSDSIQDLAEGEVRNNFTSNGKESRIKRPLGKRLPNILSRNRVRRFELSDCSNSNSDQSSSLSSDSSQELTEIEVRNDFTSNGKESRIKRPLGKRLPNILSRNRVRRFKLSDCSKSNSDQSSSPSSDSSQELTEIEVRNNFTPNEKENQIKTPLGRCRPNILSRNRVRLLELFDCSSQPGSPSSDSYQELAEEGDARSKLTSNGDESRTEALSGRCRPNILSTNRVGRLKVIRQNKEMDAESFIALTAPSAAQQSSSIVRQNQTHRLQFSDQPFSSPESFLSALTVSDDFFCDPFIIDIMENLPFELPVLDGHT